MRPITPFIAEPIHFEYALLSPFQHAAAAESLQMVIAASKLAIGDVRPISDLTRLHAAARRGMFEV